MHPRFEDLSNVASGLDNPNGYRFVEFPIYNLAQAGLFKIFGRLTLEEWGRLVTIFSSLLSSLFLYLIVKKRFGNLAGFLSAFFFLFIPYNIYYSRTILPDPSMVTAVLGSIFFFDRWLEKSSGYRVVSIKYWPFFLVSLIFMVSALLLKPYAAFFALPMVYLAFEKFGWRFILKWQLWIFMILSFIPLGLWRAWMTQYPEGIASNSWLFNEGNIRFTGAFFYWLFADRMGRLILGYWGLALFIVGFLSKVKKNDLFFAISFLVSSLVYMTVIARGNVQHDYYQILIIPSIVIFMGIGASSILESTERHRLLSYSVFLVCTIFTLMFGWYFARDYFNINNPSIMVAGQAVDRLTPKNAKILAPYDGDTAFLYQTKRSGWASFEKGLPDMIKMGADYLVLVNPKPADYDIGKTYRIVSATGDYILFNLHKKP